MMDETKELRRLLDGYEKQMTGQSGEFYHARAIVEKLRSVMSFGRLLELVEAEVNGMFVVLPCKVGDTVYAYCDVFYRIAPYKIDMIQLYGHDLISFCAGWNENGEAMDEIEFDLDEIGKTVFFTEAAALAAKEGAE
jgi:hypothetical protein